MKNKISEEEFLQECLKFLDYFKVDYKKDTLYMDSGGNSCICNSRSQFAELFGGYSINSVTRYVAEKLGKKCEYLNDEYDYLDEIDESDEDDE